MSVASLTMKIASLVFTGGLFFILFKRIKVFKKYGLLSIIYALLIAVLLSLPSLLNLFELKLSDILLIVVAQVFIFAVGVIYVKLTPSTLPWYKMQQFGTQVLFIACILLLAFFFSNMSMSFLIDPKLHFIWYISLLWFVIPVLLKQTTEALLLVPPKVFKLWYYPQETHIDDPSDEELENPIVISFIFQKNNSSNQVTTFRAKAPVGMQLGRLFYFFINDYNSRHPEGTISFIDTSGQPNGWVFFKLKSKFFNMKKSLDPGVSIYSNDIKENDILICDRININQLNSNQ